MGEAFAAQAQILRDGDRFAININGRIACSVNPDEALLVHAILGQMLEKQFGELQEHINVEVIHKHKEGK